jgi:putative tricarboxylic transport membrane protein
MDAVTRAVGLLSQPDVLLVVLLAAVYGLFVGAMPGLTVTMAVALFVPFAMFLNPVPALAAIVTLQAMGIFAGDIPAALVRMPGTPASAAYVDDSFALSQRGKARLVLAVDVLASSFGGLLGAAALMVGAPLLAEWALGFSSFEYFWLAVLGLSSTAFIATGSPLKGAVSVTLGLLLATVGIDITLGFPRFTFGIPELLDGVGFIPAMIGLFGFSEVLRGVLSGRMQLAYAPLEPEPAFVPALRILWRYRLQALRGGLVGLVTGVLPGAGADIGAWLAYGVSRKFSKEPQRYGRGSMEAIVESGVANNSDLAAEWIPTLVFGIPGDSFTAVVLGILMMKGMRPGPAVLHDYRDVLVAIYLAFILANVLMVPFGFAAIRASSHLLRVPRNVLLPAIAMVCVVGSLRHQQQLVRRGRHVGHGGGGAAPGGPRLPSGPGGPRDGPRTPGGAELHDQPHQERGGLGPVRGAPREPGPRGADGLGVGPARRGVRPWSGGAPACHSWRGVAPV